MITYSTLLNSPDSLDQVINLIEKNFNYNDTQSYASDFSPLMNNTNWQNLHLLKDGEKVIAHIGARVIKTVNDIPILFIGGIAVDEKYQGKGHFKELFDKVTSSYKDEVALTMLWSDLDGLYEKYKFHQAGVLLQTGSEDFSHQKAIELGFVKLSISELDSGRLSQLRACYEATMSQFIGIKRGPMDWGVLSTIQSTDLYIRETGGVIDFYFFVNKGMDLKNIIHEFAGLNNLIIQNSLDKIKCFKTWLPLKNPWFKLNSDTSLYMGLFRIEKPEIFTELIYIWSDGEIEVRSISENDIVFHFLGYEYTKTHSEFLSLLMGPGRAEDFLIFQKELWITGIDSI